MGLFVLGPALGVVVGYVGDHPARPGASRVGVRRDYESLYALGVAFTAFAAAEAVGGSGFLAAFAGRADDRRARRGAVRLLPRLRRSLGRDVPAAHVRGVRAAAHLDRLPGGGRTDAGSSRCSRWALRTAVLIPVLRLGGVEPRSRRLIAWLGPRGLSTLLLVLLPVFAGVAGLRAAVPITCLVVLLSVVVHGGGIAIFLPAGARSAAGGPAPAPRPADSRRSISFGPGPGPKRRSFRRRSPSRSFATCRSAGEPVTVLDVRTERSYRDDAAIGRRRDPDAARRRGAPRARAAARSATPHWSSTVPERTKPQAPGWRESFVRQDGRRPGRWLGGWTAWKEAGLPVAKK